MNVYLTPAEAQHYVGNNPFEPSELGDVIDAVSRMIDGYCGDFFGRSGTVAAPESRTFTPNADGEVRFGPFNSLAQVVTADASYVLVAPPFRSEPQPYRELTTTAAEITVAGVWGWPSIPAAVKQACRLQVARVFSRKSSPVGVAGFGEFGVVRVPANLDPDVRQLLQPYRRGDFAGIA